MNVAENLSNRSTEDYLRTSISRSYYSVFLESKRKIESRFGQFRLERPGDIHNEIIDKLKELRLGHLADKLVQLRKWRTKADYFISDNVDQNLAKKALTLARKLHSEILQDLS